MKLLDLDEDAISVAMEEIEPRDWAQKVYMTDTAGKPDRLYKKPGRGLSDLP
jgi:4-oxalocrotonate tautomerase